MSNYSPLRYPGGKANLTPYLRTIIQNLGIEHCSYFELFAGGAGAALNLLFTNVVNQVVLNDADSHIYSFWKSILEQTDEFIQLLETTPTNMESWYHQRDVYNEPENHSMLEIGFSTFFLNRCNRSGIITKAGPIGGFEQKGQYKIDCRFNKTNLIKRIKSIADRRENIEIYNEDTLKFINNHRQRLQRQDSFLYLDPPYFVKGKSLYLNYYTEKDHEELRNLMSELRGLNWMISYDDVQEIRDLYAGFNSSIHTLNYSLQTKRSTNEFFVFSDTINL